MSDGRDDRQRPNDDIKHSTLHLARDAILCVETSEDVDDQISPSIPRNIEYGAIDTFFGSVGADSRGEGRRSMHSSETATPRNSRSEPVDLQNHRRHRASLESTIRGTDRKTERDQLAMSGNNRRNPLESGIKSRHIHSTDFSTSENRKPRNIRELSRRKYQKLHKEMNDRKEGRLTSNVISSSKKLNVAETPDLTPAKNTTKDIDSNNEPSFAYQEVVRGRANRQALPGHECEECRKWYDANPGYDRREIVMECSRHRSRHIPPSTPPDFWNLTFVDER